MPSHHTARVDGHESAINDGEHGPEHAVQRPLPPIRSPRVTDNHPLIPISTPSANSSIASVCFLRELRFSIAYPFLQTHPLTIVFVPEAIPHPTDRIPESPPTDRDTTHIPNRYILTKEPGLATPGLFISLEPKAMSGVDILTFNAIYGRKPENHAPLLTESKARPTEEYLPEKAFLSASTPNSLAVATQDAVHPNHKLNTFGPANSEIQKNPTAPSASSYQVQKKQPPADTSVQAVAKKAPKPSTHNFKVAKGLINPADSAARYEAGAETRARAYANLFSNANHLLDSIKAPDDASAQTPDDQLPQQRLPFRGLLETPPERSNSRDSNAISEEIARTLEKLSKLMSAARPEDPVSNPTLEPPRVVDTPQPLFTTLSFSDPTPRLPVNIPSAHVPNALHPFTARSLLTAWLNGGSYADMASPGCTEHGDPDHRPRECKRCRKRVRVLEEWKIKEFAGGYKQQEGRRWVLKWMLDRWGVECEVEVEGEKVFRK